MWTACCNSITKTETIQSVDALLNHIKSIQLHLCSTWSYICAKKWISVSEAKSSQSLTVQYFISVSFTSQLSAGYCHFGWLVSRVWHVSVRAINRSTSGFPNMLVFCCCWQCTQLKAGPCMYVPMSTTQCTLVQSAVLWSHVVHPSVRPSVCDVGGL